MISRTEFYYALSLAVAAASAPEHNETPINGNGKLDLNYVCFDFWPNDSVRIVGTNGRRLAVTYLHLKGLPNRGKFLVPLDKAAEMLLAFAPGPCDTRSITITPFDLEQMILTCSGGQDVVMLEAAKAMYPEYHLMLEGDQLPAKGAVYDYGSLQWIMEHSAQVADGAVSINIRSYGPTTFRPRLRDGFSVIKGVILAIKPFKLVE